jgi:hypothetical protein
MDALLTNTTFRSIKTTMELLDLLLIYLHYAEGKTRVDLD